ncbi:MAG: 50S ribosomal protein L32 [Phycisphaerae bacterium]
MLPVQRISKARKRQRRSHHALTPPPIYFCKETGTWKLPHAADKQTGYVNSKLGYLLKKEEEGE